MKIIIAGGTGFIGAYLAKKYKSEGHDVIVISRTDEKVFDYHRILWSDHEGLFKALNHADLLINMAGKSVDCRYTKKNRLEILNSRVHTTKQLADLVSAVPQPPKLWINSSTATIYRHAQDRPMTENEGDIGSGFSVDVATAWEDAFYQTETPKTRKVALRTAIVLGKNGGAFQHFRMWTKMGFGGPRGNGKQMVSFVHVEDLARAIDYIWENKELMGVYNVASPKPITNKIFMKTFREVCKRKVGIPLQKWMLEIGAFFIGTETELLLKSRWVLPDRLEKHGFQFQFGDLSRAIQNLNGANSQ
jgi:uncharacterized protein